MREAFSKNGGNLGETGCVSWMFAQQGVCVVSGVVDEEKLLEASLEGGADYYEMTEDEIAEVFTVMENLEPLHQRFKERNLRVTDVELRWIPSNYVEVTDREQARSLLKLIDTLEGLDDVQNVTSNLNGRTSYDFKSHLEKVTHKVHSNFKPMTYAYGIV